MATRVPMQHPSAPVVKKSYRGFSWTTFFFGPFPALFRGDGMGLLLGLGVGAISLVLPVIPFLIWGFFYNANHAERLISAGWYPIDGQSGDAVLPDSAANPSAPPARVLAALPPSEEPSSQLPPGWYADPAGGSEESWWDGSEWTAHRR